MLLHGTATHDSRKSPRPVLEWETEFLQQPRSPRCHPQTDSRSSRSASRRAASCALTADQQGAAPRTPAATTAPASALKVIPLSMPPLHSSKRVLDARRNEVTIVQQVVLAGAPEVCVVHGELRLRL